MRRKEIWSAVFISFIASFATLTAYLSALQNGFVNFDDNVYVYKNAAISTLDWGFIKDSFFGFYYLNWHPLTMISYAVDYSLWGLDPFGYHLTNIVLHSINTFLVGILACMLLKAEGTPRPPLFTYVSVAVAALLFGLHPVHVESVAWISERKDVLSGLFFLLAIIAYIRYSSSTCKALYYSASLLFSFLALISKPMAVTLPLVLLILDYYPLKRQPSLKAIVEKIPFALLALLSTVMTLSAQTAASSFTSSLWERALVSIRAYVFYLKKMALPLDFAPFYPIAPLPELFSPAYLIPLLVCCALAAFCVIKRETRIYPAVFAFYLITLVPVIGIVQISTHLAADRYMYLPSLGPFMLAGIGTAWLAALFNKRRHIVLIPTLAILVSLAFVSKRQIHVWEDSISLWSHEIEQYPSVYLAYNNRAVAFTEEGHYMQAIEDLQKSINLAPDFIPAYINLGDAYRKIGRKETAAEVYSAGLQVHPDNAELLFERGLTYNNMGEFAMAAGDFTAVLTHGFHIEALIYRAAALIKLGDLQRAADDLSAVLKADPQNALAHYGMAEVYFKSGNAELASYHRGRATALGYR